MKNLREVEGQNPPQNQLMRPIPLRLSFRVNHYTKNLKQERTARGHQM
jgi:hypothetical protein